MKKWKPGNKVKFLNEKGGGIITSVKNQYEVIVQLPDGIEIPYPADQLIDDNKNLIILSDNKQLNENISSDNQVLYLAIESNTHKIKDASEYYIYLYNLSEYHFYYTYSAGKDNNYQCLAHGKIQAFEKQKIKTLSALLLKNLNTHQLQMIFYQENLSFPQSPVFETIILNEKTFTPSQFIQHPEFEKPVYIIILKDKFIVQQSELAKYQSPNNIKMHLSEQDWKKINELKEKTFYTIKEKQSKKQKYSEEMVMDLHIEELVENPSHLTPHEILQLQLSYFERELHNAIANNVKKITIIHGVGNGRLKYEVREYLKTIQEIKSIEDAPYKLHGFGATLVFIK